MNAFVNTLVQFSIAPSGHEGFPLLAEGFLHTPEAQLPIIEYGRNEREIYDRVFGFAQMHSQTPTREAELYDWWKSQVRKAAPFVDNKSGHWDKWTGPQEYRR